MNQRLSNVLPRIVANQTTEAAWLNTLSYLEYAGARKISRSVGASHPRATVLEHLADKNRHAAAFARLAGRLRGNSGESYLAREAAGVYLSKLDLELSAWATELVGQRSEELDYLLASAVIDRRAARLYASYQAVTSHVEVRAALERIVGVEESHALRIERECVRLLAEWDINDLAAPSAVESAYFAEFWSAVEHELALAEPLAAA